MAHRLLIIPAIIIAILGGSANGAHAQVQLNFSGSSGGGSLTFTLPQPAVYDITTAGTFPLYFVFDGIAIGDNTWSIAGDVTYSIDGGAAQPLNSLYSDLFGGPQVVASNDTNNTVAVGQQIILSAGSFTISPLFEEVPASGLYTSYILNSNGDHVSSYAVPEPSTWALLALGAAGGFVALGRQKLAA